MKDKVVFMKEFTVQKCGNCNSKEFKSTYKDKEWTIECKNCGSINRPSDNYNPCWDCSHEKCYEDDKKCIEDI